MSEQAQQSAPPSPATAQQLRFACPHCRLELSAPLSVAGVVAPCPGCGESIQAPEAPVARPERQAAAVQPALEAPAAPPPEPTPAPVPPPEPTLPPDEPAPKASDEVWADEQERKELPSQRRVVRRRKRAARVAKPDSNMSDEERREVKILIKFILSVLATAAITWAVCKVVTNSIMKEPPPSDSRPFIKR